MAREAISALQFFKALYDGVGAGNIEIRPIEEGSSEPPHPKFFSWPKEVEKAAAFCESLSGKAHVYFGVGLRRMTRKPKDNPDYKLGGKENVGCVTAAFADFDFKDVPEEELRKALSAFSVRPSIVVHSGHGIHAYWLLDYPAMGEFREALQEINLGLLRIFKAQRGPQDYTRILRVPGTANIKAEHPDPKPITNVTYFHPENRYSLEHMRIAVDRAGGFMGNKSLSRPEGAGSSTRHAGTSTAEARSIGSPPPPVSSGPSRGPRPIPMIGLPEQTIEQMGILFGQIWIEGQRHAMALRVSGLLAFSNVNETTARGVVAKASSIVGGDTEKRMTDVRDTYARFVAGGDVVGGPDLERMIDEEFPAVAKENARKVLGQIRGLLPQPEKKKKKLVEPDFEVVQLDKFDGRPPLYTVTLRKIGADATLKLVRLKHKIFHYFSFFREAVNEETDEFIANIEQWQWERMREEAKRDGRLKLEAPPQEATVTGVLHGTLESFLEEKKESPTFGELRSFPGYNDEAIFFRLQSYSTLVKESGLQASPQVITEFLRREGWTDARRRIIPTGPAYRLWCKPLNGKAQKVQGNGHIDPASPSKAPEPSLFESGGLSG